MKRVILAGVSMLAIALGGCSMFHSRSSETSEAARPSTAAAAPAQTQTAPRSEAAATTPSTGTSTMPSHAGMTSGKHVSRNEVRQAQQALQTDGLYKGKVDGIDGPQTRQAVAQFQKAHGLKQTGRLDRQTLAQLKQGGNQSGQSGSTTSPPSTPSITGKDAQTPGGPPQHNSATPQQDNNAPTQQK